MVSLILSDEHQSFLDEVVVGVSTQAVKHELFSVAKRVTLLQTLLADDKTISVMPFDGLMSSFARQVGAKTIVRGLRIVKDFEQEFQMALISRRLAPDIDVICLMAAPEYTYVSSSIVKEVALLGGDITPFVPSSIKAALEQSNM